MSSAQHFNFSIVVAADTARAKAGLGEVKDSLQSVSAEAEKTARATGKDASALDALAVAAGKAALKQDDLAAAERRAADARRSAAVVPTNVLSQTAVSGRGLSGLQPAAFQQAATAADDLRGKVSGLNISLTDSIHEMMAATVEAREYQFALDEIRASFNPLFAASRQYEAQLDRIAAAEKAGAISAKEAAAARERAAQIIAPTATAGNAAAGQINSAYSANLMAQFNDIGVTAAMGMSPMQVALQQGTQISQVFQQMGGGAEAAKGVGAAFMGMLSPISLGTLALVGFGTAGIQWLMSVKDEAKSFDEALEDLSSTVSSYERSLSMSRASAQDLARGFGDAADEVRRLLAGMAELDALSARRAATDVLGQVEGELGLAGEVRRAGRTLTQAELQTEADIYGGQSDQDRLRGFFGLNRAERTHNELVSAVLASSRDLDMAEAAGDQIEALTALVDAWRAAAEEIDGISEPEEKHLKNLSAALLELQRQQGLENNTAATAHSNEMVQDYQRRIELEQVILRYGEESAQVRQLENIHERESLLTRLEGLQIARDSVEAERVLAALADLQAVRDAAANEQLRQWLRTKDDEIDKLRLERSLVGATSNEQARALALAEAELEIRNRKLGLLDSILVRIKAITRAEAAGDLERDRSSRELRDSAVLGQIDLSIGSARDPMARADLEGRREYAQRVSSGMEPVLAQQWAAQVRAQSIAESISASRDQAVTMREELEVRRLVTAQVDAGLVPASEANRLIRQELELRPLVAAAARAEGAEKAALLGVVNDLRAAHMAIAAEERRQAQNDLLRGQAERIAALRLELQLMRQTADVRARVLAMIRAEQEIRELGLAGPAADELRQAAAIEQELGQTIAAQADAWRRVQSAGEGAIDGILDRLREADFGGALEEMAREIEGALFDLAVRNPLKNILLGTDLGTIGDVGGLGGIWDGLTGKNPIDEAAVVREAAKPVQAMTIAATHVTIGGPGVSALLTSLTGSAANLPGVPASAAAVEVLQSSATGGALRPDAISRMDAALAEPLAAMMSEAQRVFGAQAVQVISAYRPPERQQELWQQALQKYGSAEAARRHVAPPGASRHNHGLAADLRFGSPEVREWMHANAQKFGLDFRMKHEPWHIEPLNAGAMIAGRGGDRQTAAAGAALTQFGQAAQTATGDLGTLGKGFDLFGSALSGAASGGLNGLLSALGSGFAGMLGVPGFGAGGDALTGALRSAGLAAVPGFAAGGDHRGGWRIVGENGPELEATGSSRIFNAAQTREILTSRSFGPVAAGGSAVIQLQPVMVNNTSVPMQVETEETTDARGQRQVKYVFAEMTGDAIALPGGEGQRAMSSVYGLSRAARRRNG